MVLTTVGSIHDGERYRLKDREKALVFQELATNGPCSRKSIAERTGIRPTTVSRAVKELIEDRFVTSTATVEGERPGRPEVMLRIESNRLVAVSMYVQARELRTALINLGEQTICEHVAPLSPHTDNTGFLKACSDSFRSVLPCVPPRSEMLGIALSLVGTVAAGNNTWISAARWRNIRALDFGLLSRRLELPVTINRMQDAELQYLVQKNPAYHDKNVLFLHWGFGIGASYAHGGVVMGSTIGRFCEIGHTRLSIEHGKACQCGAVGCLETEAALWAIRQEIADHIKGSLTDERELGRTMSTMDIADHPAIDRATRHVMLALLNLHQVFYPDVIVIAGPFTENQAVFQRLCAFLRSELPDYARDQVEVLAVTGGFHGSVRGSVYRFFRSRLKGTLTLNGSPN
ncbi:MAG: ROK family transcriptional regulator [Spirochaetaceae bacterium]|nr:MAG: ROK family transcriptional regulator [Spirochaetaceae bacterium]